MRLIMGIALVFAGQAFAATELAKVNSSVITLEEFNRKHKESLKFFQFKTPSKKGVLDDMVKREIAVQEARKLGIDRDPEIIDRLNTVLYHALIEKQLTKEFEKIQISDDEAKSHYRANPEIRTSHIFVNVRADAPADMVQRAKEKISKIKSEHLASGKMSFAEVAQRFSEGVAAPMGGDIDYQGKEKLDPVYYQTALALKNPGKVSDIVRSQYGFHIIKLTGVRPWEEADKGQVKRVLFEAKRAQIFDRYINQLKSQAKVSVKYDLIKE